MATGAGLIKPTSDAPSELQQHSEMLPVANASLLELKVRTILSTLCFKLTHTRGAYTIVGVGAHLISVQLMALITVYTAQGEQMCEGNTREPVTKRRVLVVLKSN